MLEADVKAAPIESSKKSALKDPIADLVRDHRIILSVVDAFESYARGLTEGTVDPEDCIRFCVFLREFGSVLHHEKEEHIALAALEHHGFQSGGTPHAEMHDAHQAERSLLLKVIRFAMGTERLSIEERRIARESIEHYAQGVRKHLRYEEEKMYPAFAQTLSADEMDAIAQKLRRFDAEHNESGQFDWLLEQAESLEQKYGPA